MPGALQAEAVRNMAKVQALDMEDVLHGRRMRRVGPREPAQRSVHAQYK